MALFLSLHLYSCCRIYVYVILFTYRSQGS